MQTESPPDVDEHEEINGFFASDGDDMRRASTWIGAAPVMTSYVLLG